MKISLKLIAVAVTTLVCATVHESKAAGKTTSGKPEVTIAGRVGAAAQAEVLNLMLNRGYTASSASTTMLVVERPVSSFGGELMWGSGSLERITFNILELASSTRVLVAAVQIVQRPGQPNQRVRDHFDRTLQAELDEIKSRLEPSPSENEKVGTEPSANIQSPEPSSGPSNAERVPTASNGQPPRIVPDLGIEMLWIPPGKFVMGSPESEDGRAADQGPQTQVSLTAGFWLGKCEITQGQWQALMGDNPSKFKDSGPDYPVEYVSWKGAMEFCEKLTERERTAGRLPDGYVYTLPTEAQWEYACRAGTTGRYAGTGRMDDMGWYDGNSGSSPQPVDQKNANAWGLHDMHGNVWEWCIDWYQKKLPGGSVVDPLGIPSGLVKFRVFRGGGWSSNLISCRSAARNSLRPFGYSSFIGFRVALAPPVPDQT